MSVCLCYNNMPFSFLQTAPKGHFGQLHFVGTSPIPIPAHRKQITLLSLQNFDFYHYGVSPLFKCSFLFFFLLCFLSFEIFFSLLQCSGISSLLFQLLLLLLLLMLFTLLLFPVFLFFYYMWGDFLFCWVICLTFWFFFFVGCFMFSWGFSVFGFLLLWVFFLIFKVFSLFSYFFLLLLLFSIHFLSSDFGFYVIFFLFWCLWKGF